VKTVEEILTEESDEQFDRGEPGRNIVTPTNVPKYECIQVDEDYQDESRRYPMGMKMGFFLIFNQWKFKEDKHLPIRYGSVKDEKDLAKVLTDLEFKVYCYRNRTKEQILANIALFAGHESNKNNNAFGVCVMSHGNENGTIATYNSSSGTDGICNGIQIRDIADCMNKYPIMLKKPKLLFVQACRGAHPTPAMTLLSGGASPSSMIRWPADADLLTVFATSEKRSAIRNVYNGSWFIQSLVKELELSRHNSTEFHHVMIRVNNRVAQKETIINEKIARQIPQFQSRLTKELYLRCEKKLSSKRTIKL